ncbi:hypothetical protein ACFOOK_03205 [Micromonospora krabiensis]|uniref:Uncharacterized protein n=1 Tax=Micromonospora krabiensis TaxID=307121 RepID=A0A1C3MWD5_9ACTN|nr:hypothetical protein [Micromonospora krabiensis]SBV24642.1 hypothetical protein GA0070620_0066 [Micromonospora krabiensis]
MVTIVGERRRARRTPQEKKQLSYEHDRRNNYGENDKASRKSIRRNKRYPNRSNRHHDRQVLDAAAGSMNEHVAEAVEQTLYVKRRRRWRKWPDIPLGVHVEAALERRQQLEDGQGGQLEARLQRLRRRGRRCPEQGMSGLRG